MSLSRRNLIVKLCCPFVLHSSRNIGESSFLIDIDIDIDPTQQPSAGLRSSSHISQPQPTSLRPRAPHNARSMHAGQHAGPRYGASLACSSLQITHSLTHTFSHLLTLVSSAPATSIASVCGGPGTSEPVRALSRPSSRLAHEMISQFWTCVRNSHFDSRVCLAGASQN